MSDDILTAAKMPTHLRRYWLGPKGSARVGGWGNEGSYTACQREMRNEGVPGRQIDGLCANLYHAATGRWPGESNALTAATWNDDDDAEVTSVDPRFVDNGPRVKVLRTPDDDGDLDMLLAAVTVGESALTAGFFKKWREADHPRDEDGKFTDGADTPDSDPAPAPAPTPEKVNPLPESWQGAKQGKAAFNAVPMSAEWDKERVKRSQRFKDADPARERWTQNFQLTINDQLRKAKGDLDKIGIEDEPPRPEWLPASERNYTDKRQYKEVEKLRADIEAIDSLMDPIPEPIVVHRGLGNIKRLFGDDLSEDLTGKEWTSEGFISTSSELSDVRSLVNEFRGHKPESWSSPAEMRILLPKGTKAMSPFPRYQEITLDRGLRYRVVADHGVDSRGFRQIDVEVVP